MNAHGKNDLLAQAATIQEWLGRLHSYVSYLKTADTPLTFDQALVLSDIDTRGRQTTPASVAVSLDRELHTVESALDGLERKGLIVREPEGLGQADDRLRITEAGRRAMTTFHEAAGPVAVAVRAHVFTRKSNAHIPS